MRALFTVRHNKERERERVKRERRGVKRNDGTCLLILPFIDLIKNIAKNTNKQTKKKRSQLKCF